MTISQTSSATSGATDEVPLSPTQNFLRLFDQGGDIGPFSARYNIVVGWRLRGPLDVGTLQLAMDDVVARHDSLRASIARGDGPGHQVIHPPSPAYLTVRELGDTPAGERDRRAEELLGELEAGSYPVEDLPHLRAVLGRFDGTDAVLALIVHHTASDGWSMQLLMRDIAARYAVRRGHDATLPAARSYAEYVAERAAAAADPAVEVAREYWREKLRGARILAVPTDHPRSAGLEKKSPVHRFSISAELTSATLALARALRCSPFMVLHAAYNTLLHKLTGATDLVIPTIAAGRNQPEFQDTVGPFFNFVPLRTVIDGCATFRDVVERTRTTCIEAMAYDLPFVQIMGEAPELMSPLTEDDKAACAFQVWQFSTVMDRDLVGDIQYTEVRSRTLNQADGTDIPDGALLTLDIDPSGEIFGNIAYNSNLYTESSMIDLAARFRQVLHDGVTEPGTPLTNI
jgi:hypothetical protein